MRGFRHVFWIGVLLIVSFVLGAQSAFAQTPNPAPTACPSTTPALRTTPAANDPDITLSLRGWSDSSGLWAPDSDTTNGLINNGGKTDSAAPQLSTLFGAVDRSPVITSMNQVNQYPNGSTKTPISSDPSANDNTNWGVTLLGVSSKGSGSVLAPAVGREIAPGLNYAVLYASSNELTLKNTTEDNVVAGYTLHFVGLTVNKDILTAYQNNKDPNQLVAISCGMPIGTPDNGSVDVAIRDTGSFMDPRIQKDWWHDPTGTCGPQKIGTVPITSLPSICPPPALTVTPQVRGPAPWPVVLDWISNNFSFTPVTTVLLQGRSRSEVHVFHTIDNTKQGNQMQSAMIQLLPNAINKKYLKLVTYDYHLTGNHVNEFEDPANGNCHYPNTGEVTSVVDLGWNKVRPAAKALFSALSMGSMPPNAFDFFDTLLDETVGISNGICGGADPGQVIASVLHGDVHDELYNPLNIDYPATDFFNQNQIDAVIACLAGTNPQGCSLTHTIHANTTLSTNHPGATDVTKWASMDTNGVETGFPNVERPNAIQLTNAHGIFTQDLDLELNVFNGTVPVQKTPVAYEYGRREHMNLLDCSDLPQAYRVQSRPDLNCVFPTATPSASRL